MNKLELEVLKIIALNHINVDIESMIKQNENLRNFFYMVYTNIDERDMDVLIFNLVCLKDFDLRKYVMPYFEIIISKMQDKLSLLEICIGKLESKALLFANQKIIKEKLDPFTYTMFFSNLVNNDEKFALEYKKEHKWLYEFRDLLNSIGSMDTHDFEMYYMMPLIKANAHEYLNYVMPLVFENKPLDICKLNRGTHNFAFAINDLVIRFGNFRRIFEIYNHFRINEFIIRKRFFDAGIPYYLDICPKANMDEIIQLKDIDEALNDLRASDLVVTDRNYEQNFGVVDYEMPKKMFRDVEGIIGVRGGNPSYSFYNKPTKLIDQDYIYDIHDENKIWTGRQKYINVKK